MRIRAKLALLVSVSLAISGLAFAQSAPKKESPAPKTTVAQTGTPGSAAAGQTGAPAAPEGGVSLGVAAAAVAAVIAAGAAASSGGNSTTSHFTP